jgi:hypothetical protein
MIISSDKEYIDTKRFKRGEVKLEKPYSDLASWIEEKYDVNVLNVIYDIALPVRRPRLQVCVESQDDCDSFRSADDFNFDDTKQKQIIDQFAHLVRMPSHSIDIEKLFVVFSAFEPIAREEANGKIDESEIESLKSSLGNKELWKIRRSFGGVTFFFYTVNQANTAKKSDLLKTYSSAYFELIKKYDEFNYLTSDNFYVSFDSKENFDKNYKGSWFAYDR